MPVFRSKSSAPRLEALLSYGDDFSLADDGRGFSVPKMEMQRCWGGHENFSVMETQVELIKFIVSRIVLDLRTRSGD